MTTTPAHPYSPARRGGGLIFVSGALSIDEAGAAVPGRREAIAAATDRMWERLATVGGRPQDLLRLTYYVTDVSLRDEANAHFAATYAEPRPSRTFVEVAGLPYGATVEIEAVALDASTDAGIR